MIIKAWKRTAVPVAFAVWLAYLAPAVVISAAGSVSNFPRSTAASQKNDPGDDDDKMSSGELAALIRHRFGHLRFLLRVSQFKPGRVLGRSAHRIDLVCCRR